MIYILLQAALNAATKSMSHDFRKSKILAVALHPGWVQTEMGGPKAPLTPDQSAAGITKLLESLNESHNGTLIQYDGKKLDW
jgi:NAD(P)-dependent dehydrogenase (short-subunit alcohol dehydrogenase family)